MAVLPRFTKSTGGRRSVPTSKSADVCRLGSCIADADDPPERSESESGTEIKTSGQRVKNGNALNLSLERKGPHMRNGASRGGIRMNKQCSVVHRRIMPGGLGYGPAEIHRGGKISYKESARRTLSDGIK
jgi:hypothetical protein